MRVVVKLLTATLFALSAAGVAMSAPAGSAINVDPEAGITSGGTLRTLVVGADVFIGDLVRTSTGGSVQVLFKDGTRLVVGPGSSLRIEDYLLRADGSAGNMVVGALAGTFRFVSGNAAKDRYAIKTPGGTIGIRGTEFDFVVDGRASTRVLMYHGATDLCSSAGKCSELSETCELGEISGGVSTSLGLVNTLNRAERKALRGRFLYGASQQPLDSAFRIPAASRCLHSATGLPFSMAQQQRGAAPAVQTATETPGGPVVTPPTTTPPPTDDEGGDCAGHSNHNPGNSQNCSH